MYAHLPLQKSRVGLPVGEPGPPDPDVFEETEVPDLVATPLHVEHHRRLYFVRFDAPHVVRRLETMLC